MMEKKHIYYVIVGLIIVLMVSVDRDIYFGEITGVNISNVSLPASNIYVNISGLEGYHGSGVTYDNSTIIINNEGYYSINAQYSFSGTPNNEYHLALGVDGTRVNHCHSERVIGSGGDVGSASFTCIDYFNESNVLTLMIENVDSAGDPDIHDINLNVRLI